LFAKPTFAQTKISIFSLFAHDNANDYTINFFLLSLLLESMTFCQKTKKNEERNIKQLFAVQVSLRLRDKH
jgi:hypothetical protein